MVAGSVNLTIALAIGASWPRMSAISEAALLSFLSYGLGLVLFVLALRRIGTARTGAYFSVAPFAGAVLAIILLRDNVTLTLGVAAALMAVGIWLPSD